MKGFGGGMQQLMKQANQMQNKMKKIQEELKTREFEGTASGGAITAKVNGDNHILALEISDDVFEAGDKEMLQDMVIVAINEANKLAKDTSKTEMDKVTGGMGMPGMF